MTSLYCEDMGLIIILSLEPSTDPSVLCTLSVRSWWLEWTRFGWDKESWIKETLYQSARRYNLSDFFGFYLPFCISCTVSLEYLCIQQMVYDTGPWLTTNKPIKSGSYNTDASRLCYVKEKRHLFYFSFLFFNILTGTSFKDKYRFI